MHTSWVFASALGLFLLPGSAPTPRDYQRAILDARKEQAQSLDTPTSWLSLVALTPLTAGDVSVGSAPGTTVHLEHGLPHAFTLHVAAGRITFAAVDPAVMVGGRHPQPGDAVTVSDDDTATVHWGDLWANAIERTGNQTYLRVGDPNSPNRRNFHGLNFYPVNPAYRVVARWVPYTTPHEIHMGTVLGTVLTVPSPGYAEFTLDNQAIRLDGTEAGDNEVTFSFRDSTYQTTTYGAGRHITTDPVPNGLKAPGPIVLDFNTATNWPCAYTQYGTCPLPPKQNRFDVPIPAGEKRYHN